jgi:diadenosine tetraphosphatase ApaH/serine/threonine PP2A family protein phosphatase
LAAEEITPGVLRLLSRREVVLEIGRRYIVNVGSVGQPRQGQPEACWILVEDQPARVFFRSVSYDIASAQAKIRQAGLPEILASRLSRGE